jgi:Na+-translocating ferredoxin:NAD+ oxidoreductase RnfC subunit
MRVITSGITSDSESFLNAFSCSSCGLCEMYACGQGLNPRSLIGELKGQLRKNGMMPPRGLEAKPVDSSRQYRTVPMSRLIGRLGLAKYDVDAPIVDVEVKTKKAKIKLAQSIGVPSTACVSVGDNVKYMDVVGAFTPDKLGTAVHAPFDGKVTEVTPQYVVIEA